jgi:lipopolysaccharide transport system permease protein
VAWAVIRPLLTVIAFTIVFGRLAQLPSNDVPYIVLVFAALLPWQLFSTAFAEMGTSLLINAGVISKIYFPRMLVPLSVLAVAILDFIIAALIFIPFMLWYSFYPDWRILTLPLFFAFATIAVLGPGLLMAALTVKYRDLRYVVPFIVQVGLYISPVGFSSSVVPEPYRLFYFLNPMAGVIEAFRWALLRGTNELFVVGLAVSAFVSLLLLVLGIVVFRRAEESFADLV